MILCKSMFSRIGTASNITGLSVTMYRSASSVSPGHTHEGVATHFGGWCAWREWSTSASVVHWEHTDKLSRTNVDIDDQACAEVMRRYQLATKSEAVNFALRTQAAEPVSVDEARALRGIGWEGDLEEMRSSRLTGS